MKSVIYILRAMQIACVCGFVMCIFCVDWAAAQETGEDVLLKIFTALCGLNAVVLQREVQNHEDEQEEQS